MDNLPAELKLQLLATVAPHLNTLTTLSSITPSFRAVYKAHEAYLISPIIKSELSDGYNGRTLPNITVSRYPLALAIEKVYSSPVDGDAVFPSAADLRQLLKRYRLTLFIANEAMRFDFNEADHEVADSNSGFAMSSRVDLYNLLPPLINAYILGAPKALEPGVRKAIEANLALAAAGLELEDQEWLQWEADDVYRPPKSRYKEHWHTYMSTQKRFTVWEVGYVLVNCKEGQKVLQDMKEEDGWGDIEIDLWGYLAGSDKFLEIFELLWKLKELPKRIAFDAIRRREAEWTAAEYEVARELIKIFRNRTTELPVLL